jgi:hypothetical protein
MESRALGRTDNRDCLGAWYDILKEPHPIDCVTASGRGTRSRTRWWRRR